MKRRTHLALDDDVWVNVVPRRAYSRERLRAQAQRYQQPQAADGLEHDGHPRTWYIRNLHMARMMACFLCGAALSAPDECPQCGSLEGLEEGDEAAACVPVCPRLPRVWSVLACKDKNEEKTAPALNARRNAGAAAHRLLQAIGATSHIP
jgi:hypothetical protein